MSRYQIIGIDPTTEDHLGNTVEVHDTFVVLYYESGNFPFSEADIVSIQKATQKDVVMLPHGTKLQVVKVLKPEG